MSEFIDELLIVDIVSRLPIESVLQCRCVCKRWRELLHEHHFTQIHTDRTVQQQQQQQQQQIVSFFMLVNIPKTNNYEFHLQDYYVNYADEEYAADDDNVVSSSYSSSSHKVSRPLQPPQLLIGDIYTDDNDNEGKGNRDSFVKWFIMGSINGLICLYGYNVKSDYYNVAPIIIIYNPITREYLNVPADDDESFCIKDGCHMATGFGYNPKTNEYKIVRIIHQGTSVKGSYVRWIQIYTLGSGGKWRITKEEGKIGYNFNSTGVSFKGAIYWLADAASIVYLDLEDEMLREIPAPLQIIYFHYELRVFAECLCVIEESTFIWRMNNNGPYNNKTYLGNYSQVSMPKKPMWSSARSQFTPIAVTRKSRVLCLYNKRSLVSFDPRNETCESLGDIPMFEGSFRIVSYTKSLVSLKALGEEDAKTIEKQPATDEKKRTNTTKRRRRRSINMKTQMIKLFTSLLLNFFVD